MNRRFAVASIASAMLVLLSAPPSVVRRAAAGPEELRAGPAADTAAVLGRIREAVGFDRLARQSGGLAARGSTTVGGVEAAYVLRFAPGGRAIQRIDGDLDMMAASDGASVWITDLGGESRVATDADRETQLLGLVMLTHDWMADDSLLRVSVDEGASTPQTVVLRFAPVDGRVGGRIEVDRTTWLPRKWSYCIDSAGSDGDAATAADPSASVVSLSDWIDFDGIRIPGRIEQMGHAGASLSIRLDSLEPAEDLTEADFAMPAQPPPDTRFDPTVAPAIEVVKAPTGHLLVHPLVNGKDVGWFIFDTGAGMNVLTSSVADALVAEGGAVLFGEVPASGVGGTTPSKFCRPRSLSLGPATVAEPLTVVLDLSFLDQHMGRKIGGLIGHNFISRVVTELDLEGPAIAIHDPRTFDDDGLAWQPLVLSSRLPHVRARFALPPAAEGEAERVHAGLFRLDTGAAQMTVSMHEPSVRTLRMLDGLATTDSRAGGVGGYVPMKKATLAWFELGGAKHIDVPAEFALEAKGAFADPLAVGNIGGALLRPFELVLDYPNGRIAFRKRG